MELRLNFLHLLIAEMELKVERHKQRNTNLKSHCDKLRREKRNLKEALKEVAVHTHTNTRTHTHGAKCLIVCLGMLKVEEDRLQLKDQLINSSRVS